MTESPENVSTSCFCLAIRLAILVKNCDVDAATMGADNEAMTIMVVVEGIRSS